MQRREQQRRAAAGGPSGGSYLGGGISGYAPVPQREFNAPTPVRTASPAPSSLRAPAFFMSCAALVPAKESASSDAAVSRAILESMMGIRRSVREGEVAQGGVDGDDGSGGKLFTGHRTRKHGCVRGNT